MTTTLPDLINYSFEQGERILATRSEMSRKQKGQFLTPPPVARFMAQQLGSIHSGDRILDPAIGSGVLACAVIEQAIAQGQPLEFWLDGYEIDAELGQAAREALAYATEYAAAHGVTIHTCVYEGDFVLNNIPVAQPYLFLADRSSRPNIHAPYDYIIANPPYFKLNSDDERVKAVEGQVKGHTNIYTLFLALAAKKLTYRGKSCFIVPRSFCSGVYFSTFRREFIQEISPLAIHLFESRQDTFKNDTVLQENIIFTFGRQPARPGVEIIKSAYIQISASKDTSELSQTPNSRPVALKQFLGRRYGTLFLRLLTGELDEQLVEIADKWTGSLHQYGMEVSTGPVVAFRAQSWLTNMEAVSQHKAMPLLWMQNVKPQQVEWPVMNGNKPQGIILAPESQPLLIPLANYVLLRRFSAKEEPRRLIAAPFLSNQYRYQWVGLENHLNYIGSC
jgi:adenine-specific DNA-methyltransferase